LSQHVTIEKILENDAIESYIRYLAAFKVIESDYGLFDKLARPRDINDLSRVIYESIRVQDRVLKKLAEGVEKGIYEIISEVKNIDATFRVGKECLKQVIEIAEENPRLVGSLIASLALAYEGIKVKER